MIRGVFIRRDAQRRGFTIIEVLVALVVGLLVMTSAVRLLIVDAATSSEKS
jgi:prepilin-type N-terminal cleavage/methylation domain-containing protein